MCNLLKIIEKYLWWLVGLFPPKLPTHSLANNTVNVATHTAVAHVVPICCALHTVHARCKVEVRGLECIKFKKSITSKKLAAEQERVIGEPPQHVNGKIAAAADRQSLRS